MRQAFFDIRTTGTAYDMVGAEVQVFVPEANDHVSLPTLLMLRTGYGDHVYDRPLDWRTHTFEWAVYAHDEHRSLGSYVREAITWLDSIDLEKLQAEIKEVRSR
jgi:hypothetical protein